MSWQDQLSQLVYTTDKGRIKEDTKPTVTPGDGTARVRRETKGRKGKGVMVISGLGLEPAELKKLASKLKKACGTGGSVVDETIEIQGDIEDSLLRLVDKNLQYKDSDFYVIQDISEDTRKDTLTVVVNLYNQSANYSLSQHPA